MMDLINALIRADSSGWVGIAASFLVCAFFSVSLRARARGWVKVVAWFLVGVLCWLAGYSKEVLGPGSTFQLTLPQFIGLALFCGIVMAFGGLSLVMLDRVSAKAASGQPLGYLTRIYFDGGWLSLVAWFFTVIVIVWVTTIFLAVTRII